jgi:hypothetical protein
VEVKRGALLAMSDPIAAYDRQARELAGLHESLSLKFATGTCLTSGAGSGRDANWFAGSGWDVVAVEPAEGKRREGQQRHPQAPIRWLSDRLPGLQVMHRLVLMFDLVQLSSVWMRMVWVPAER